MCLGRFSDFGFDRGRLLQCLLVLHYYGSEDFSIQVYGGTLLIAVLGQAGRQHAHLSPSMNM